MTDKCNVYKEYCSIHDFIHGAEAEELREGLQNIIENAERNEDDYIEINKIQNLLDKVDARDSLAYLDAKRKVK